jgi:hypothetical protein
MEVIDGNISVGITALTLSIKAPLERCCCYMKMSFQNFSRSQHAYSEKLIFQCVHNVLYKSGSNVGLFMEMDSAVINCQILPSNLQWVLHQKYS